MQSMKTKKAKVEHTGLLKPAKARKAPLWAGPCGAGPNGGITFSLLSRFLVCRERFRLQVVEGLKAADRFNHKLDFGNMWHVCEEAFAASKEEDGQGCNQHIAEHWKFKLTEYCKKLCTKYPLQQSEVAHWHGIAKMQFPLYVDWWAKHPDVTARAPLMQEVAFDVPYALPSGRTVRLRGKWDSVDLIGKGKGAGVYLQENKTKSRIDETQIKRQLSFDLQTMLYLTALYERGRWGDEPADGSYTVNEGHYASDVPPYTIKGIRYNVIRRTEHRVGKKETEAEFLARLKGIVEADPGDWFMRWKVEVGPGDVAKFRRECLDPILEQLCWWYDEVTGKDLGEVENAYGFPPSHFRLPFGIYNPLLEGNATDVDEHLASGSEAGLARTDNLFPELQEL